MKLKYVIGAALLILAVALFGCGAVVPMEGTTEPAMTEATELPTTETTEAPTTEAPSETEGATDESLAEACRRSDLPLVVLEFEDTLPEILRSASDAEQIRQKISEIYGEQMKEDGTFVLDEHNTFAYWIDGDVLSVVRRLAYLEQINPSEGFQRASDYHVYNFRISDGKQLTVEEVLESAGVTEEEFYKRVAVGTGNACCAYLPGEMIEISLSSDAPMNSSALWSFSQTTSEEYVHRAIPYLNDDGELWFAGYVRQVAGADYYTVLLPYEQTEEFSPYYEQILTLALEHEG